MFQSLLISLSIYLSWQAILSCPAVDKSGTGNSTATPEVLTQPCEFDTCPVGSPAIGFNASDRKYHSF